MTTATKAPTARAASAALATREAAAHAVVMMDHTEAREAVAWMRADIEQVDASLSSFRQRALDFREREGWRALGYAGYLEAINAELGTQYSASHLSRLVKAASIERLIDLPMDKSIPERVIRPLSELDTVDQQREAWDLASERAGGTPTARDTQQAVDDVAAFDDARERFAALGWKLERHGVWYKLSKPDGDHYATTQDLAPQLNTLATFEAGAARRAQQALERRCGRCEAPAADLTSYGPGTLAEYPDGITLCHTCIVELLRIQRERDAAPVACATCGKSAISKANIGGRLAWRCEGCATLAECEDLQAQLGAQYRGAVEQPDLGPGPWHFIAWARGGGGYYRYTEALDQIAARARPDASLRTLCERAEQFGATIDYTAQREDGKLKVLPPAGYQQTWIWCNAADLGQLCGAWERTAPVQEVKKGIDWDWIARRGRLLATTSNETEAWEHWRSIGCVLARNDRRVWAARLLGILAPLMADMRPEDQGALAQSIDDLHGCQEGTEGRHWTRVGWALLDVEAPEGVSEGVSEQ